MVSNLKRRSVAPMLVLLSMLLMLVIAAPVAAKNPPGNNGTVKIDGVEFDRHPNNEPHVGCTFEVDFYGFDEGDLWADVTFEAHPPTGRGVLLQDRIFIGEDDNSGGGSEAGWDASREYNLTQALSRYPVHPQQGYHVKLTVNADGSQGADTKHKVFWVGPCDSPSNPPNNPPENPPNDPPGNPPNDPPANPPGGGTDGASAPPRSGTAGSSGGPTVPMLPDTAMGATSGSLVLLGVAVMVGGTGALALAAVRRNRSRRR
ncbi:MAG: hypothetical protein ACRDG7_09005 [Candidatus Limnocylindria bacterium]